MKNYFLALTICSFCIILDFGKASSAQGIEECSKGILQFYKVGNTSGNYVEVISRSGKFVALKGDKLSIYDNHDLIYEKIIEISTSQLSLDIFKNILFSNFYRLGIYVPDNDEIIWKNNILRFDALQGNIVFDENNTIYVIINNMIHYVSHEDDTLDVLPRLENFKHVTHLVKDHGGTFYFAYKGEKTSWIVNGKTKKLMLQTSLIKSMIFSQDPFLFTHGYLYFIDEKCSLKALKIIPSFDVFHPELTKIMDFVDCEYRFNDKCVFNYEGRAEDGETYVFNKNKIYAFRIGSDRVCLKAKLENVTINAAATNFNYIMLATTDGLWVAE